MRDRFQQVAAEGEPGERGKPGKSAYDVAREAGYRGTLAQWLVSLKGGQGDRGERGLRGEKGEDGAPAMPMLPTSAEFVRDPDTHLTALMVVNFPVGQIEVTPQRDADGFMYAARFEAIA